MNIKNIIVRKKYLSKIYCQEKIYANEVPGTEQLSRAFTKLVHLVREVRGPPESHLHTRPTRENISCDSKNIIEGINWCNVDQDAVIVE